MFIEVKKGDFTFCIVILINSSDSNCCNLLKMSRYNTECYYECLEVILFLKRMEVRWKVDIKNENFPMDI